MAVQRKRIRLLVEQLLARHLVHSAPVPVEDIAKANGVDVTREPAEDDLSGFIFRDRTTNTAVIGVNSTHHPNRQNFTLAHELGHFLLHEGGDDVHVDRRFQVKFRSETSSQGDDVDEKEANLFAAELLMPADFLEEEMEEIDVVDLDDETVVAKLARRYGVSTQAMTFRLAYLGYVRL